MTSWKSFLGFGALALFAGLVTPACASNPGDDGSATDDSADELSTRCGGIANIQCKAGYSCDITSDKPDAMGTCRKQCGGVAGLKCSSSSECVLEGAYPDAGGICRPKSRLDSCTTDADCVAISKGGCCPNGWNVAVNKDKVDEYDAQHTCTKKMMCPLAMILDTRMAECNVGTHTCQMVDIDQIACGGFTWNPHACPDGYSCNLPANIPDAPGKCVKKACVQNKMCTTTTHWDSAQCACVANPMCGGFAGLACPSGYSGCVDNPNDGCDPKNGGADCPGVCTK